ncbi:MAG: transposase/DNA replication protein DnaC [Limisphaerales bacterium]
MIDYQTWLQIRDLKQEELAPAAIARKLKLDPKTVIAWMDRESFQQRRAPAAKSKLDSFKPLILRLIELHAYTGSQIFIRLRQEGYQGGYTILTDYLRRVRPRRKPAFLKLHFEPGDCAQVDWGTYRSISVGSTTRRLSFFVMVLSYSRRIFVHFTLGESQEQFLDCHRRAFEYFGAVPARVMVDNCKVAVLHNRPHQEPAFNAHYVDFAQHYGFKIVACGVGYVRKNFLAGHTFTDYSQINPAALQWLEEVANVRKHGETGQTPLERFEGERDIMKKEPQGQQLEEHASYLKLGFLMENHEDYTQRAAQHQWSPQEYLIHLLEGEVGRRRGNQVQRRIKSAKFPVIKTLEQFDWSWPKKINRQHVLDLFRLQFLNPHANVIFMGGVGLGKTRLATALGYAACQQGVSVLYSTAVDIINTLVAAQAAGRLKIELKRYLSPSLLILDELGYLPIDKTGADSALGQTHRRSFKKPFKKVTQSPERFRNRRVFRQGGQEDAGALRLWGHCGRRAQGDP